MSVPQYKGTAVPIVTCAVNWRHDVKLREIYKTSIVESLSMAEERHEKYPRCLYAIDFTSTLLTPREQGALRKQFEQAEDMPFGVPLWSEQVRLASAVASGEVELPVDDATGTLFNGFGHVILWRNQFTWEVLELAFATASQILLEEATTSDWPAGTLIAPVAFGWCRRPKFPALNDERSEVNIQFEERWHALSNQTIVITPPSFPPVVESTTSCRDTYTYTWGSAVVADFFRIELADSKSGPWLTWVDTIPGAYEEVTVNNYFGGAKYLRISAFTGGIWAPFVIKRPLAPVIAPPSFVSLTHCTQPLPLEVLAESGSAEDGAPVSVVSSAENPLVNSLTYLEVKARWMAENNFSNPGSSGHVVVDWSHADPGVTLRWTRDNTSPTSGSPLDGAVVDGTANNCAVYDHAFGHILRCRAFKDGCQSPEIAVYVDKHNRFASFLTFTSLSNGISGACDYVHMTTGCNNSAAACLASVGNPCEDIPTVDAAKAAALANKIDTLCAALSPASVLNWILRNFSAAANDPAPGINYYAIHWSMDGGRLSDVTVSGAGGLTWGSFPPGLHCVINGTQQALGGYLNLAPVLTYAGASFTGPSGSNTALEDAYNNLYSAYKVDCPGARPEWNNVAAPIPGVITTLENDAAALAELEEE